MVALPRIVCETFRPQDSDCGLAIPTDHEDASYARVLFFTLRDSLGRAYKTPIQDRGRSGPNAICSQLVMQFSFHPMDAKLSNTSYRPHFQKVLPTVPKRTREVWSGR